MSDWRVTFTLPDDGLAKPAVKEVIGDLFRNAENIEIEAVENGGDD